MNENEQNKKIAIVACSGAANTGQTANEVTVDLCKKSDNYSMVCLVALTLSHKSSLEKLQNTGKIVIIDGCAVKCASEIVKKYGGKKTDLEIQIMEDYGIKKTSRPIFNKDDVKRIARDIDRKINR
ncbi:MAG: hypothetical protein A2163_01600 [Actinobacteria bacterium RBG_13_35_12]|nr:MAG: hypothetical protein A2163_01600 [Actinobacteria bacterium RBG_13_35_12]